MRSDDVRRWLDGSNDTFDFAHLRSLAVPVAESVPLPVVPVLPDSDLFSFGPAGQGWQVSLPGTHGSGSDWHDVDGSAWHHGDGTGSGKASTSQGVADNGAHFGVDGFAPDTHGAFGRAQGSGGGSNTPPPAHLDGLVHPIVGSPGYSFRAVDGFNNLSGDPVTHAVFSPPDNGLAASGNSVVSAVNDTIGFYSANLGYRAPGTGTSTSSGFTFEAFSQFFPSSLVGKMYFTDPQVVYDTVHSHYIVTEELYPKGTSSTPSYLLVAVSKGGDNQWHDLASFNTDWNFFKINTAVTIYGRSTGIDYPQADVDGVNLYVSGDQYFGNTYAGNSRLTIPLSQIELPSQSPTTLSIAPVVTGLTQTMDVAGDVAHSNAWFVGYGGVQNALHNEIVTLQRSDPATTFSVDVGQIDNLSVTTLTATEVGGHLIDASDRRIIDAKVAGDKLFAVAEIASDSTPHLHWFEFNIGTASPTLLAQGELTVGSNATYNGALAFDANGNGVISFTASGSGMNPTDFVAVHRAGVVDPASFWETPTAFAQSPSPYSDGQKISRWGDYASAIVDPAHAGGFLVSNEYAVDSGHWGTATAQVGMWLV